MQINTLDVILCSYNAQNTIEQCIVSILSQTFSSFKLYIFDDCSTDDTVKIIKNIKDKRVLLVSADKNVGTYSGKNFLLRNFCSASFIALHDADDYSTNMRFEKQIQYLNEHDSAACVGSAIREFWDPEGSPNRHLPHTISNAIIENNSRINVYNKLLTNANLKELALYLQHDEYYKEYIRFKIAMNGSVMFRHDILKVLGGWDASTRIAAVSDLFIRMLANHEIHNLDDVLYNRRFHKESLTASESYGIDSYARMMYNKSRYATVEYCLDKINITCNMSYPKFKYEIISCVE